MNIQAVSRPRGRNSSALSEGVRRTPYIQCGPRPAEKHESTTSSGARLVNRVVLRFMSSPSAVRGNSTRIRTTVASGRRVRGVLRLWSSHLRSSEFLVVVDATNHDHKDDRERNADDV